MGDPYDWDEEETPDEGDDEAEADEHPSDDDGPSAAAEREDLSEAEEERARHDASLEADALLREFNDESDEPITYSGDEESLRKWAEWLEKSFAEKAAEQAEIDAVYEAEQAGMVTDERTPIDFGRWDGASFTDLVERVTGRKAANAPRRGIDDDEFSGALALLKSEE